MLFFILYHNCLLFFSTFFFLILTNNVGLKLSEKGILRYTEYVERVRKKYKKHHRFLNCTFNIVLKIYYNFE